MASSNGTDASKSSLRTGYLDLCKQMPRDFSHRVDVGIREMFDRLDLYRQTSLVLGYIPIHEEIDTIPILREALLAGKRVALPHFNPQTLSMSFYEIASMSEVTRGARGLAHPPLGSEPLTTEDMLGSICLVPGLVFDGEGYRVGYGAGYYDEFLQFYPGDKIGLVRSVQVSSNALPHDDHEVAVDVLVTEGSIWRCRKL